MSKARIDLVPEDQLLPETNFVKEMLGTLPISVQAYAHSPEILKAFMGLEAAIFSAMSIAPGLKGKIGFVVSKANGCNYCAAHAGGMMLKGGMSKSDLVCVLNPESTDNEADEAALAFTRLAVAKSVTDDSMKRLKEHYNAEQIIEIVSVIGFFSWTNHVHDALGLEIEEHYEHLGAHLIEA
ncbi:MAG: carboxymuconolactone decarboxylase family protein [Pseudomonadales bacterium]|nr:carboxymuconolactone decarboxylase family protein [Pseudomonadales bacterium]